MSDSLYMSPREAKLEPLPPSRTKTNVTNTEVSNLPAQDRRRHSFPGDAVLAQNQTVLLGRSAPLPAGTLKSVRLPSMERMPLNQPRHTQNTTSRSRPPSTPEPLPAWAAAAVCKRDELREIARHITPAACMPLRQLKPNLITESRCGYTFRPEDPFDEIDLVGGNGRFRQRKAEAEFARRRLQDFQQRQEHALRKEKERLRQLEEAEKLQRIQLEMQQAAVAEADRRRRDDAEQTRLLREEKEREQVRLEEERLAKLRSIKITCNECIGNGLCFSCKGTGQLYKLLLAPRVEIDMHSIDSRERSEMFGQVAFGCKACANAAAFSHLSGDLWRGNGMCAKCSGHGTLPFQLDSQPVSQWNEV
jgi:hypothetical protein